MKLSEIAQRIDKSKRNEEWVDTTEIGMELGVDIDYLNQDRLRSYWVGKWLCTDTYVGHRLYFFDDEPVAYSVQTGRKTSENFFWFSQESAKNVKEYLLSLMDEEDTLSIAICDVNQDIGDHFKIKFNNQVARTEYITYKGENVALLDRIKNQPYGIDTMRKIQLPSGQTLEVDINELDFGFHLTNQ